MNSRLSILAIDLTTYGLAFVAFENGEILDWGQRHYRRVKGNVLSVIDELLDGSAADVLVLEDPDDPDCQRRERVRADLRTIRTHVRRRRIPVEAVARGDVRRQWRERGYTTKESVAAVIAARIPELAPYVPPKRKISRSEDERVNLFDAASLALHAFPSLENR